MEQQSKKYGVSSDGLLYGGSHTTIEEAMKEEIKEGELKAGDVLHVGECDDYAPSIDTGEILDSVLNEASSEIGEAAQSWSFPKKDTPEFKELDEAFNKVFNAWLVKHDNVPSLYKIAKSQVITITEEMVNGTGFPTSLE